MSSDICNVFLKRIVCLYHANRLVWWWWLSWWWYWWWLAFFIFSFFSFDQFSFLASYGKLSCYWHMLSVHCTFWNTNRKHIPWKISPTCRPTCTLKGRKTVLTELLSKLTELNTEFINTLMRLLMAYYYGPSFFHSKLIAVRRAV